MARVIPPLLLLVTAMAGSSTGVLAQNLLANPGFESGWNAGWTVGANVLRESLVQENAVSWNNAQWYYHSGSEAVSVAVGTGNGDGKITQRVAVSPGVHYTARVNVRAADNVASHTWGNAGDSQRAELVVRELDSLGNQIGSVRRARAAESMDWEALSLAFTATSSTASVEIQGYAYMLESFYATLGRAVFDDFSLEGPPAPEVSIGVAKSGYAGQRVSLPGKTVTASFDGFFYIQEADRSAGIRVDGSAVAGRLVDVTGTVSLAGGEPEIKGGAVVDRGEAPALQPVRLSTTGARTLLPVGLLSACCGRVVSSGDAPRAFAISDGGAATLRVYCGDGKPPLDGTYVRVRGALGSEIDNGAVVPALRAVAVNVEKGIDFDLPSILWAPSKRPDGTTRFWDPAPVIRLGSNLLCVAYRPRRADGSTWYSVGLTPPRLLEETLVNAQPELREMHDHGIAVVGYADCILFYPDMLDHDSIDYSGLHALDANLAPVTSSSWGPTSQVSCVNNPQWIDLQRQAMAVTARSGIDHLQLDIYPQAIAPGYCCHCMHCRNGWTEVSRAKFGQPQPMPPATLDFSLPAHRAYFEWRLDCYSEFVERVEEAGQAVNPHFKVLMNQCADTLDFVRQAMGGALDMSTSEIWHLTAGDESSLYMYRLTERANGGRLTAVINDINQVKPGYRYRVCIAEAYAGGGNVYAAAPTGTDEIARISTGYYDFIRSNQECYVAAESQASVAVLYSWRDHAYIQKTSQGPTVAYGQGTGNYRIAAAVLARMGVPYDFLIVEQGLTAAMLSRYHVIVAPNLRLLDDADAALLEQWVRAGGRLMSTGTFGTLRQQGDAFAFRSPSVLTAWTGRQMGPSSWNARLDSGYISYVAQPYTGDSETSRSATSAYNAAAEYVDLRRQMRITAASPVESTVRGWPGGVAIHLIRLGPPDAAAGKAVHLDYEVPPGSHVESVNVSSPDFTETGVATYDVVEGRLRVDITRLESYSLVDVRLCRNGAVEPGE